jgi:hypothetical protein
LSLLAVIMELNGSGGVTGLMNPCMKNAVIWLSELFLLPFERQLVSLNRKKVPWQHAVCEKRRGYCRLKARSSIDCQCGKECLRSEKRKLLSVE